MSRTIYSSDSARDMKFHKVQFPSCKIPIRILIHQVIKWNKCEKLLQNLISSLMFLTQAVHLHTTSVYLERSKCVWAFYQGFRLIHM